MMNSWRADIDKKTNKNNNLTDEIEIEGRVEKDG